MNQLFTWAGQSIGVSALASFLPKNTQYTTNMQFVASYLIAVNFDFLL